MLPKAQGKLPVVLVLAGSACSPSTHETKPSPAAASSATSSATTTATAAPAPSATVGCEPGCAAVEHCETGTCEPSCREGEVYVPATGDEGFAMPHGDDDKAGSHRVILTRPFCIDATEVTVAAYAECVKAKVCEPPRTWGLWINYPKQPRHPVNKVHWEHAKAYCEYRKQSLPTEAQWYWAATGGEDHPFAWGDASPTCERADFAPGEITSPSGDDGCHGGGTSQVGAHPDGDRVTPYGRIHDLSGNVWEWCLDNFLPFKPETATDPHVVTAANGAHVVRGGGWNRSSRGIRVDYRGGAAVDYQVPGLGFRCVRHD